jgi:hypothetical protein
MSAHLRSGRRQPKTASVTRRDRWVWTFCLRTKFVRCFMSFLQDGGDDRIDIHDPIDQVPAFQKDPQAPPVRHGSQIL